MTYRGKVQSYNRARSRSVECRARTLVCIRNLGPLQTSKWSQPTKQQRTCKSKPNNLRGYVHRSWCSWRLWSSWRGNVGRTGSPSIVARFDGRKRRRFAGFWSRLPEFRPNVLVVSRCVASATLLQSKQSETLERDARRIPMTPETV